MLRSTLVEKTQLQIKQMILDKEYNQQKYLPSEGELCERFGVSRATVREAVRSMEVRGFVSREHGKGIRVTDNRVQVMTQFISDMMSVNASDLLELIEVRGIIEVEAARLAAVRAGTAEIELLRQFLVTMESTEVVDDDYSDYCDADLQFHSHIVKASKNNLLHTLTNAYTPLLRSLVLASTQASGFVMEKRFHFHRNLFDSICSGDPEQAAECMRVHIRFNQDTFREHMIKTGMKFPGSPA